MIWKAAGLTVLAGSLILGYSKMNQQPGNKEMAEACALASPGASVQKILFFLTEKRYSVRQEIFGDKVIIIVRPQKAGSRYGCFIEHDGEKVLRSEAGLLP